MDRDKSIVFIVFRIIKKNPIFYEEIKFFLMYSSTIELEKRIFLYIYRKIVIMYNHINEWSYNFCIKIFLERLSLSENVHHLSN